MRTAKFFWLAFIIAPAALMAQQRPLLTEDPRLIATGTLAVETGTDYFQRARFPSGLGGNELQAPVIGLNFGLGERSEFQISGALHNFLWVHENGTGKRNDWGDFSFSTKILLLDQSRLRPVISFRPTVVLPNSNKTKGIGTDTTQVFGSLLFGKTLGRAFVFGSAGMGILDDTVRAAQQEDVLVYGLAALVPVWRGVELAGEWNGRKNPQDHPTPGGEDHAQLRFGARVRQGRIRWDAGVAAGLTRLDPSWGLVVGLTKEFRLWK